MGRGGGSRGLTLGGAARSRRREEQRCGVGLGDGRRRRTAGAAADGAAGDCARVLLLGSSQVLRLVAVVGGDVGRQVG